MIVTGQSFQEEVEGTRSLFTTDVPVKMGSLQVFQQSLAVNPASVIQLTTSLVRFINPSSQKLWECGVSVISSASHGLQENDKVVLWSSLSSGLPLTLSVSLVYYARNVTTDSFQLATEADGEILTFSVPEKASFLYFGIPYNPNPENGVLYYTADTLSTMVDDSDTIGCWGVEDFSVQYASNSSSVVVSEVLTDALSLIEQYVDAEILAKALAKEAPYYQVFRRVMGELAYKLLLTRGEISQIRSAEKSYADNIKKMSQTYQTSESLLNKTTLGQILSKLILYKKKSLVPHPSILMHSWGTGRDFGLRELLDQEFVVKR